MEDTSSFPSRMPRTSFATVVGVTALLVAGLLGTVSADRAALVGVATGGLLALSLWLSGWDRWQAVGTVLASVLALPVAVGLSVATGGAVVSLGAELFPVASQAGVRPAVVTLVSQVVVVLGCLTAVFGATAATRGIVDIERVETYGGVVVRTTAVPFAVALVLFARGAVDFLQSNAGTPGVQQLTGDVLTRVLDPVFDPVPGRTHIAIFSLLVALAAAALTRGLDALPLAELVPETSDAPAIDGTVNTVLRTIRWTELLALLIVPVAGLIELTLGQQFLTRTLPSGLYDPLVAVTAAPGLRGVLWWLALGGTAVAVAVWFLRRTVQSSADRVGTVLAPYVGGGVITLAAVAVAGPAVDAIETALRATPAAATVEQFLVPILDVYGPETVTLALAVVALFSVISATGQLWVALATNYLREQTAGITLAAAGLFGASAFAATLSAPTWLVLAGLVGAVVVWDAGSFGTTMGREVGTEAATRRTELVHTGGTVAVGGVGAAATLGLAGVARGAIAVEPSVAMAGLVVCLVAVLALVAAIR
ncbi:hypothetical protein Har1130_13160 [Haloarcula sp. CBA1130]|uniref:DUF7519 family protein n=1 Tax=unclassified Haloarcula TaxID=2624677 RepID=UPI001245FA98|nr:MULTISPECIES: hypothetical protein [unclassified Haloarcula]KAA9399148.1 hypothetical protein Har1129_13260 [Haloarcula sp. CBA1129]KAA9403661.1 hypothetical protein Har1130_13160 [Haloarcula sp. CBA1130]